MSARGILKLRRRLAALGAWVADARHVRDGDAFLVQTSRFRQRVMRPGTARAFAERLEDERWGLVR
jgi:hypothetical protein